MFGTESDPSRQFLKMTTQHIRYVSKRDIAKHFGVSERTIDRYKKIGIFRSGIHYVRKFPNNNNSPLLFLIDQCDAAYRQEFLIKNLELAK
jgi:Zn-dependent peptidase ImmA (M78 family)